MSGGVHTHTKKYISRDLALKYEKRGGKFTFSLKFADTLKVPQKDSYLLLLWIFTEQMLIAEQLCDISNRNLFQISGKNWFQVLGDLNKQPANHNP